MDRHVYAGMAAAEGRHWWFVARRRILADALRHLVVLPEQPRILEAGCGTGGNLGMLAEFGRVDAFEPDDEARAHAQAGASCDIRPGALPDSVPFADRSYELVAALDIIEHVEDDLGSLRRLFERLRPGGWVLITVPAYSFLWSGHDDAHHHKRRYVKNELKSKLLAAGFVDLRVTYFNTLLFPLIAGLRLFKRFLQLEGDDAAMPASGLANRALCAIFSSERFVLRHLALPFGVSLLAIARRPAS